MKDQVFKKRQFDINKSGLWKLKSVYNLHREVGKDLARYEGLLYFVIEEQKYSPHSDLYHFCMRLNQLAKHSATVDFCLLSGSYA